MKSQKLGRGLGALLGEMDEAYENEVSSKDSIVEISLKDIRANPYQPRKFFDENSLHELGLSIKTDGLIQPIIVTEDIDGYIIIAGERRYRASKLMKLKTIRAIVFNSNEEKMRQFALIENIQRDELNAIELADAYSELIKLHSITHEELSSVIHKSRTHITNTLRLLQLSSKTKKALIEKKITAGHARVLVGLEDKEQQLVVNSIIGQKLSVRDAEQMVKGMKVKSPILLNNKKPCSFDFSNIKEKFDSLDFNYKISSNKLIIEFENENQIKELLKQIS
ncbi:MAG: ParB/RepB/Spo0J family partition protein [Campylobacterota bacterium]|nr:ParB/RepB/Spo0J family partition protein [Campylobacterota bacterium]